MARKRYTPEEIIQKLRTAEIEQSKGATQEEAARKIGVTPVTLSRWKAEFGGMRVDQAKRLKELEQEKLETRVIELASEYGRYGYRHVTDLLQMEGWSVGKDRVYSIWQREGLKVPQKQPKRSRLWLADGSCIRLRPEFKNHA